jgi:L-alanine-DL-glutamate epimerase-like enolase superfamily enzyme
MRITSVRTRPLALAFKKPYRWAGRVDFGAINVLVEIKTDEGITGYGESIAARPADSVIAAPNGVGFLLLGESPFDIEQPTPPHPSPSVLAISAKQFTMPAWRSCGARACGSTTRASWRC